MYYHLEHFFNPIIRFTALLVALSCMQEAASGRFLLLPEVEEDAAASSPDDLGVKHSFHRLLEVGRYLSTSSGIYPLCIC